jgi:two-component system chemotaxis response regulator CheY
MSEPGASSRHPADTVLVVDDYDDARETLRELIEESGHPVIEATNAPRIGLILLDLEMPVMDGRAFLKLLGSYARLSRIPVVVVSAHAKELAEVERQGVAGCFQAPYDAVALLGLVNALLLH